MTDYRQRICDALSVIKRYCSWIEDGDFAATDGDFDAMKWEEVELIERILEGKMSEEDLEDIEDLRLTCESLFDDL